MTLIERAHSLGQLSGDGFYTRKCSEWLEHQTGAAKALLTHSCTAALEMAALLLDVRPGDEVILPSFTFVSTANAFALRGAVPVFVDVRPDTLNINEELIDAAVTSRTKAIAVVHYAGVAAEMDQIMAIAGSHGIAVVEDAAQAVMSKYRGRPLGSIGEFGALSFHETKNIICGEGGALLCRDPNSVQAAEIIREKGTNRSRFFRGEVDKYTWVDLGSSYLPAEVTAAFLFAQMEEAEEITRRRLAIWERYFEWAAPHESAGSLTKPTVPPHCVHNAHMFYVLMNSAEDRSRFIEAMAAEGIGTVFHYVPLHSSPMGMTLGRASSEMTVTDDVSQRIVRLPLWLGLEESMPQVLEAADRVLKSLG